MKGSVKYILIIAGIALCFLVGVALSFFVKPKNPSAENTHVENSINLYKTALQSFNVDILQFSVTKDEKTTIGNTLYTLSSNSIVQIDQTDPTNPQYHIQTDLDMGNHRITVDNYYMEGSFYITFPDAAFYSTSGELNSSPIGIPVLNHELYDKIVGIETDNGYQIEFSEATSTENWIDPRFQLEYASGTVILSSDGSLQSSTYKATVKNEFLLLEITLTLTPQPATTAINLPDKNWIRINSLPDLLAPIFLEKSVGILVQANSICSSYREEIYFEALGDKRTRSIDIQRDNSKPLSAKVITETLIANDSRLDQPEKTVKTECFCDEIYTIEKDAMGAVVDPSIDSDSMVTYINNLLISTVMLPKYIDNSSIVDNSSSIRYHFEGNEDFAQFLCHNAGQQLYQDSNLLLDQANTDLLTCYLEIDALTMLPIASGISYKASYQKEGLPYHLTYEVHQTYQYGS